MRVSPEEHTGWFEPQKNQQSQRYVHREHAVWVSERNGVRKNSQSLRDPWDTMSSRVQLCDAVDCNTPGLPVHHQLPEFTQAHSCPSCRWCHPTTSASVAPFSFCLQSFPASGSFPMSQIFAWGGQSIGVSASASVLPMNTQDLSPLEWTGWISLESKGLSRVFSNTTVQKHQFFSTHLSL